MTLWGFDTETFLITPATKTPKPVCCTWAVEGAAGSITRPDDPATYARLSDPDAHFVGANIAFDLLVMMHWHPHTIPPIIRALDEGRVWDVTIRQCMSHLARNGRFKYNPFPSLNDLTRKYLDVDLSQEKSGEDAWRLRYGTLHHTPLHQWPAAAINYAINDARYTLRVFEEQGGVDGAEPTESLQVQASVTLGAIGSWGFGVNVATNRELAQRQNQRIASAKAKLDEVGVPLYGTGSTKALTKLVRNAWLTRQARLCREFAEQHNIVFDESYVGHDVAEVIEANNSMFLSVFQVQGDPTGHACLLKDFLETVKPLPKTEQGAIATGVDTLKHLYDEWEPFKHLITYKHEVKLNSTYVKKFALEPEHGPSEKLPEGLSVSRATYTTLVSTGRTAASPGHQTVPRDDDMRTQFQARPGSLLSVVDYGAQELATLAASFRHSHPDSECRLADALWAGQDVHSYTASIISGRPYDEYIRGKDKDGRDKARKDQPYKGERQGAKPANFGFPGGMRERAFMAYAESNYDLQFDFAAARNIRQGWARAFPELESIYLREGMRATKGGRATAQTIHGRKKAACSYNEYCNFQFQALAADCSKSALWAIFREALLANYYRRYPRAEGYCVSLRDSPLAFTKLAAFIHDEIVCEHPEGPLAEEAFRRQQELMVSAMDKMCFGLVPVVVEGSLSDRWEH